MPRSSTPSRIGADLYARAVAFIIGAILMLAFMSASSPAPSNSIIESVLLVALAVCQAGAAVSALGLLGRDLQITGITALGAEALVLIGLFNNSLTAAGIYVLLCQGLSIAGIALIRHASRRQPSPEPASLPRLVPAH
ncbi:hypothetical protein [Arthrobacter caoxuetaonis]|uniref:Uncharacterized protein n=1 Tax=Arthrobacter caoxuetaonis TaxID=2886935 RepID=A0A9X1SDJ3_9MICC|nr:hypothetical protein [Arthrobacter caoxuetaonis]MCC3299710.1 hypothetical protein [Arthrobacter caoxuetaonis]USQ59388.1 hypothetical protein NF551_17730 [Arthrobacter caoxuetaonis]